MSSMDPSNKNRTIIDLGTLDIDKLPRTRDGLPQLFINFDGGMLERPVDPIFCPTLKRSPSQQTISFFTEKEDEEFSIHIAKNNIPFLKYLLSTRFANEPKKSLEISKKALWCAAYYDSLEIVIWIHENLKINFNEKDDIGFTALHTAIFQKSSKVMSYLIEKINVNLYETTEDGSNALHLAAYIGSLEVVKSLIAKKMRTNETDEEGATALHNAIIWGHIKVVQYFIENNIAYNYETSEGLNALSAAIVSNNLKIAEQLISIFDINLKNKKNGETALHLAAKKNDLKDAEWLVRMGASALIENNKKKDACALAKPNSPIFKFLNDKKNQQLELLDKKNATEEYMAYFKQFFKDEDLSSIYAEWHKNLAKAFYDLDIKVEKKSLNQGFKDLHRKNQYYFGLI